MSRSNRHGVAYDQRTGAKVRGSKLRQDYYSGAWTTDADDAHPQDFPVIPGPDGANRQFGPPSEHSISTTDILDDLFDPGQMRRVAINRLSLNPCPTIIRANDGVPI